MAGQVSGLAIAEVAVGALVCYSGIKGTSLGTTFQDLLHGQTLNTVSTQPISTTATTSTSTSVSTAPGNTSAETQSAASNQALGKVLAAPYGWATGTEWEDLVSLWNQESGWSNTAENPTSGAYGIAQALGHGTNGAPYPASSEAANPPQYGGTSSAIAQISWGLSYIESTYGSPEMAWAHEQQYDWY